MRSITVNLAERSYDVHIGPQAIKKLLLEKDKNDHKRPIFVITNRKINRLHGPKLRKILARISSKTTFYEIPDSEKAKSFPVYIKAIRALAKFSKKTKPLVLAFGGGVVGDLAGFVASAYRRGVPYIQIPTTLLAQVDSSIGGKVAIDIKEAKNIVGDFYQPKMVICDIDFLKTLPTKELKNGLVEIIKSAVIKKKALFVYVEKNLRKILDSNPKALFYIISETCSIKARVVEKDEFDTKDIRAILNFGHTIGHAIEAAARYSPRVTHGGAVAHGITATGRIAMELKLLKAPELARICALLKKAAPKIKVPGIKIKSILGALSYDKKFINGTNKFVLPTKIGSVKIVTRVPESLIKKIITLSLKEGVL